VPTRLVSAEAKLVLIGAREGSPPRAHNQTPQRRSRQRSKGGFLGLIVGFTRVPLNLLRKLSDLIAGYGLVAEFRFVRHLSSLCRIMRTQLTTVIPPTASTGPQRRRFQRFTGRAIPNARNANSERATMLCPHCGKPIQEAATVNDALINDHDFIVDLARYAEGLLTEKEVRKKHRLGDDVWTKLGEDEALIERIEATKIARVRSGVVARERAQVLFTTTPTVLGNILNDGNISPRHKIEAAREIRAVAATGPETQPTMDRFQITINLGADEVIHLNKPIAVGVDDDGKIIDNSRLLTARKDDGNDEPV
jgi:hypothetical protein